MLLRSVMKSFVIRKWWRQLFVVAKKEQQAAQQSGSGDSVVLAWRARVARQHVRSVRKCHVIKCKALAAAVVQRGIKCHSARVALRAAVEAAAAARKEKELRRALAYEVSNTCSFLHHHHHHHHHHHQHHHHHPITSPATHSFPASTTKLQQHNTQLIACGAFEQQQSSTGATLRTH